MGAALPAGAPWPADNLIPSLGHLQDSTLHAYVHIPFCEVRCGYCDFNTYTADELGGTTRTGFHESLIGEMKFASRVITESGYPSRQLTTVFFGGGTPSLFSPAQFEALLGSLEENFGIAPGAEITVEANPDTLSPEYLAALRKTGVNRLSMGVQSFDPEVLRVLDRTHKAERVPEVVGWARQAGFALSLDLIFGTPGETIESWAQSVDAALNLGADHLSAYALIVEKGTKLERAIRTGAIANVDDDLLADKYELVSQRAQAAGLEWYEISNWARPTKASVHNSAYWRSQDWWGFGPGAHSHLGGNRFWNRKHPAAYEAAVASGSPAAGIEQISRISHLEERLLLELRTTAGVQRGVLSELGVNAGMVAEKIARGLLEPIAGDRIRVTENGRLLADGIVLDLISATAK